MTLPLPSRATLPLSRNPIEHVQCPTHGAHLLKRELVPLHRVASVAAGDAVFKGVSLVVIFSVDATVGEPLTVIRWDCATVEAVLAG